MPKGASLRLSLPVFALLACTLFPAPGCVLALPATAGSGSPAGSSVDWLPFPDTGGESGTFGAPASRGPEIDVTFPNSGDQWRGDRVTVVGRMGDASDPVTSAYAEAGGQRTPITVRSDGGFDVPVRLALGYNQVRLVATSRSGVESDAVIKVRRIPGMGVDSSASRSSLPSVVITSPTQGQSSNSATVDIVGRAHSQARVGSIEFYANGDLVRSKALPADKREVSFRESVPLRLGTNLITVTVRDAEDRVAHGVVNVSRGTRGRSADQGPLGPVGRKLAVVIGVSRYARPEQITTLQYADRDAELVAGILREAGFDEVRLLTNERATSSALRRELFDFLSQAIAEDVVLIYFAGHGAPDPKNLGNLYFLTYDTDVDSMASTAFPMWEMEMAIQRKIHSERVVLIADACHSGGIGGDLLTRGLQLSRNPTHDYLSAMAKSRGRVAFTASEASELSQESKRWGGGHGVFTWAFAEALRGRADADKNRVISLGELIDFTSEQVRRETRNQQHPDTSGRFDRGLPIVVLPPAFGG